MLVTQSIISISFSRTRITHEPYNQGSKAIGDMRAIPSSLYASPIGEGLYLDLTAGTHTFVITAGDADTCVDYIYLLCEK